MAERRMFAKTIIDSDLFLDMSLSAQALYFHLSMRADDEGFINNPKKIQRMIGASDDDMRILIAKQFIIPFDSGIVVIKHWRIHNYIQKDRFKPTMFIDEKSRISEKNGIYDISKFPTVSEVDTDYIQAVSEMDTSCIQSVSKTDTQVRLGKDSIGKDSIGKDRIGQDSINQDSIYKDVPQAEQSTKQTQKNKKFIKPTVEEIRNYCIERKNNIDAQYFYDYYESTGWRVGKNPMKDWKATIRNWERRNFYGGTKQSGSKNTLGQDNGIFNEYI